MIDSITLKNVASYGEKPQTLDRLGRVNFIYGANGSGKTTISRLLDTYNPSEQLPREFSECEVKFSSGNRPEILVYNQDFIERNFSRTETLKGIYTLGEDSVELDRQIAELQAQRSEVVQKLSSLEHQLYGDSESDLGVIAEKSQLRRKFVERLWRNGKSLRDGLPTVFHGLRNSAEKFGKEVINRSESTPLKEHDIHELTQRYKLIFSDDSAYQSEVAIIATSKLTEIEANPFLQKVIAGSADTEIGALIEDLNHSGWVREGAIHFQSTNYQTCPFCLQTAPLDLRQQLESFFDKSYEKDHRKVEELVNNYKAACKNVTVELDNLLEKSEPRLAVYRENLLVIQRKLLELFRENSEELDAKLSHPERKIQLKPSSALVEEVNAVIKELNNSIRQDNEKLDNRKRERSSLKNNVWEHLLFEQINLIQTYKKELSHKKKFISGLEVSVKGMKDTRSQLNRRIEDLESKQTDIRATVNDINHTLKDYGFSNFSLKLSSDNISYDVVRSDGKSAKDTLSEGEKTFLVFLYYYHLVRGSHNTSGQSQDRVLVIDDPVSSLDSQVLFIVGSLIKELRNKADAHSHNPSDISAIKQVIVFTHNTYFHKEISNASKKARSRQRFWTIRRHDRTSEIEQHDGNPIKSSYQFLWQDIKTAQSGSLQTHSIRNIMRRILEYYFMHLGTYETLRSVPADLDGHEKRICTELISWLHDGSHRIPEDIDYTINDATVNMYLSVFEKIFISTQHEAHYHMMMETSDRG